MLMPHSRPCVMREGYFELIEKVHSLIWVFILYFEALCGVCRSSQPPNTNYLVTKKPYFRYWSACCQIGSVLHLRAYISKFVYSLFKHWWTFDHTWTVLDCGTVHIGISGIGPVNKPICSLSEYWLIRSTAFCGQESNAQPMNGSSAMALGSIFADYRQNYWKQCCASKLHAYIRILLV